MSPRAAGVVVLAAALALGGRSAPAQEAGAPAPRLSWTSDRIPLRAGDVVTILVDELTLAEADKRQLSDRDRRRTALLDVGGGPLTDGLRSRNAVTQRVRGEDSRTDRFVAELSARVVEVLPGGVLRLEAVRKLRIDKHEQEVTVRGLVRGEDVSPVNTIESWRLADAEIFYDTNDELGKVGGFWSWLLGAIIP